MPWWMVLYSVIFGLLAFFNVGYLIYIKSKVLIVLYELSACAFLVFMMLAYWLPVVREHVNFMIIPVFITILIIDMRITIYGDIHLLGIDLPEEVGEEDMEIAGAVSLLFSAPAYIICGLVCLEMAIM